jgi:hypothetical protein
MMLCALENGNIVTESQRDQASEVDWTSRVFSDRGSWPLSSI